MWKGHIFLFNPLKGYVDQYLQQTRLIGQDFLKYVSTIISSTTIFGHFIVLKGSKNLVALKSNLIAKIT
jgi:hypothetical protein